MDALGTLAGGVAHDFNNILTAIFGYGELLREPVEDDAQARGDLVGLLTAAARARDLVSQILTFSRHSDPDPRPLYVGAVALDVSSLLRAILPSTIRIEVEADARSGLIHGEEAQIHQLLLNLGTNAGQAMADGGLLRISVKGISADESGDEATSRVCVTVEDTGAGMDPETVERIYDPFFSTKDVGEGTGLGLSVVHGIVTGHGGSIEVDTKRGCGTTFRVYLPAADPVDAVHPSVNGGGRVDVRATGRILVVDDEPEVAKLATRILERTGYEVETFVASPLAWERLAQGGPEFDLVLTDQTMPELTGLELATRIRSIHPATPVVLTTGFSDAATPGHVEEAGIREVLPKPYSRDALLEVVARAIGFSLRVR